MKKKKRNVFARSNPAWKDDVTVAIVPQENNGRHSSLDAPTTLTLSNPQSSSVNVQLPHPDGKLLWVSLPATGLVGPDRAAYMAGSPASQAMLPYCACCCWN